MFYKLLPFFLGWKYLSDREVNKSVLSVFINVCGRFNLLKGKRRNKLFLPNSFLFNNLKQRRQHFLQSPFTEVSLIITFKFLPVCVYNSSWDVILEFLNSIFIFQILHTHVFVTHEFLVRSADVGALISLSINHRRVTNTSRHVWPPIGRDRSRDLNTDLSLVRPCTVSDRFE